MAKGRLQIVPLPAAKAIRVFKWGELVGNRKVYPCHDGQWDILESVKKNKITIALAGAQGGKTALIPLAIAIRAAMKKGFFRVLFVSPTMKVITQSNIVQMIKEMFDQTCLGGSHNKNDSIYKWDSGEIIIRTSEIPENLDAGVYDLVILDEAAKMSNEVWQRIQVRAAGNDAPILLVSTPDKDNFLTTLEQQTEPIDGSDLRKQSRDKTIFCRKWKSIDRPGFSHDAYALAKKTMAPEMFARMFDGEYAKLEGLVYKSFAHSKALNYPVIQKDSYKGLISPPVRFWGGNDWGYNPDPSAFLIAAECEDGCIYILDEIYGTDITPDQIANQIRELVDNWALRIDSRYADLIDGGCFGGIFTDTSRPECKMMVWRAGVAIKGKLVTDVLAGIAITDSWFRAGRLKVYQNCENLIRELRGYVWDQDRKGELKDKPKARNDHAADALRYLISSLKKNETPSPIEIPIISEVQEQEVLKRQGIGPEKLKEISEATAKENYNRWFWEKLNLEAGD